MKKKKEPDFPGINYTFMNKSTYRKKNQKFRRVIKWILSITIVCLFAYAVFYVLFISKNPNFFEDLSNEKEKSNPSFSTTNTNETKNKENSLVEEKSTYSTDEPDPSSLSNLPKKEELSIEEKLLLQMNLYGLQDEKEIQLKKDEYFRLTGEDFETSFLFPSDVQVIPDDILLSSSREQAAVLRNEIFARHGYPFESGRLLNYFNLKKWYQKKDKQIELTDLEKTNVNKILEYEISKGWKKK